MNKRTGPSSCGEGCVVIKPTSTILFLHLTFTAQQQKRLMTIIFIYIKFYITDIIEVLLDI